MARTTRPRPGRRAAASASVTAILAATLLAGCGTDNPKDDEPSKASGTTTTSSSPKTVTQEAVAGATKRLQQFFAVQTRINRDDAYPIASSLAGHASDPFLTSLVKALTQSRKTDINTGKMPRLSLMQVTKVSLVDGDGNVPEVGLRVCIDERGTILKDRKTGRLIPDSELTYGSKGSSITTYRLQNPEYLKKPSDGWMVVGASSKDVPCV